MRRRRARGNTFPHLVTRCPLFPSALGTFPGRPPLSVARDELRGSSRRSFLFFIFLFFFLFICPYEIGSHADSPAYGYTVVRVLLPFRHSAAHASCVPTYRANKEFLLHVLRTELMDISADMLIFAGSLLGLYLQANLTIECKRGKIESGFISTQVLRYTSFF